MTTSNVDRGLPRVAVLGTGTMGSAMVGRLLDQGMDLAVWSRHASSTDASVALGATAYRDPADAVAEADVVITMLPTLDTIKEVMLEANTVDAIRENALGTDGHRRRRRNDRTRIRDRRPSPRHRLHRRPGIREQGASRIWPASRFGLRRKRKGHRDQCGL